MSKSEQIEGYMVMRFPLSLMEISVSLNEASNFCGPQIPYTTAATRNEVAMAILGPLKLRLSVS
jgi:hypothetical protein